MTNCLEKSFDLQYVKERRHELCDKTEGATEIHSKKKKKTIQRDTETKMQLFTIVG